MKGRIMHPVNMVFHNKYLFAILTCIYAVIYDYIVKAYLFEEFGYMLRYQYHNMSSVVYCEYILFCVIPAFFYKGFRNIASIFSLFCFIFVYIPFINTLSVAGFPAVKANLFMIFFLFSQIVFFATDDKQIGRRYYTSKKIRFKTFETITYILLIVVLALNYNKLHFVNIFAVDEKSLLYDLREINQSSTGVLTSYLTQWLNNIMLPILLVCSLRQRDYVKISFSFIGMILIFMIDMQKISFIMPFVIVAVYWFYRQFAIFYLQHFHTLIMAFLTILPIAVIAIPNRALEAIGTLLIMRTQCIEGKQFAAYFDFFELHNNPYTYYTHINIINKLTGAYPYSQSIGYTVAYGEGNSNATFFLMDGIAAGGLFGCILIAILFIIVKSFFNTIGNNYDKGLCSVIMLFALANLINVSLFTALLSGGFILLYLIFRYVEIDILKIPFK